MTFLLREDQSMLRETGFQVFQEELPITHLRALIANGVGGASPEDRKKLANLGFFSVIIPEAEEDEHFGVLGMGQLLEAQGSTLATTGLLQTGLIAPYLLQNFGTEAQRSLWLPKIVSGDVSFALALDETAHFSPYGSEACVEKRNGGFTINGRKVFVPDGHTADIFIVVGRSSGAKGQRDGLSLFLVPATSRGVHIERLNTLDGHGAAHISFDYVEMTADQLIGEIDRGAEVLEPLVDRAAIGLSAEMLGTAQMAFDITLEYLKQRKQFGRLIGSFQALQHRAAQMHVDIELARTCVHAALAAADDPDKANLVAKLASLAKAKTGNVAHNISNECIQMHGGIGMTDEADPGLILKRVRVQESLYGNSAYHLDRYASLGGY